MTAERHLNPVHAPHLEQAPPTEGLAVTDDLVALAREGDRRAFEGLYRGHVGRVFALCLRLSGDRLRAEELTQDVFVQAWRKLPSFRGESAFGSWLHRIAVNAALFERRTTGRRERRVIPFAEPPPGSTPAADVAHDVDLERAIASLPPGARGVFVLHDLEGYRHEDVARLLGVAVGTSKAQLHRARRLLRKELSR